MKTFSYSAALAAPTAIKTSIATVAAPVTYATTDINGAIGLTTMFPPRSLTVTTAANAASYVASSTVTITGTDDADRVLSEVFTLTGTGGGQTLAGTKAFKTVVSIAVAAQADTSGAFTFGVRDVICSKPPYMIRALAAGNLKVGYADGTTDTIPSMAAKEYVTFAPTKIYGDSGTTVVGMTLFFA